VKKVVMCGADVHDNTLCLRIAVNKDKPETRVFHNTAHGREALLKYVKLLARKHGADRIVLAYEASSLGFGLYEECVGAGVECFVLAPTKMPQSEHGKKCKTDEEDAQRILEQLRAHILAGNDLACVWIPDAQTRDDREVLRTRLDVAEKLTEAKTQVRSLLKRHGVAKPRDVGQAWTKSDRHWLTRLTEEESELSAGARVALGSLLRQIASLEAEIERLDQAVEAVSKTTRYQATSGALVEGLQGVGLLTAMVYLTELGDLSRFRNRKQVGSFLGLVPSSHESGEIKDRKGHITRQGPSRVRKVLCQATWSRVSHDENEGRVYQRIVEKNAKRKKIATVACMRRLGVAMWRLGLEAQRKAGVFDQAHRAPKAA